MKIIRQRLFESSRLEQTYRQTDRQTDRPRVNHTYLAGATSQKFPGKGVYVFTF